MNSLYLSNPLKNESKKIKKPKLKKVDIISSIEDEYLKEIILIRNQDNELEYEVFVSLNGQIYAYTFDANTGERKAFGKSERIYFDIKKLLTDSGTNSITLDS